MSRPVTCNDAALLRVTRLAAHQCAASRASCRCCQNKWSVLASAGRGLVPRSANDSICGLGVRPDEAARRPGVRRPALGCVFLASGRGMNAPWRRGARLRRDVARIELGREGRLADFPAVPSADSGPSSAVEAHGRVSTNPGFDTQLTAERKKPGAALCPSATTSSLLQGMPRKPPGQPCLHHLT
jgi:hypothetical protein